LDSFQSTRPARGATRGIVGLAVLGLVSIHAPRAGRDPDGCGATLPCGGFQSTRPARGATCILSVPVNQIRVSIHAPRAGRDRSFCTAPPSAGARFNPRAPRGARRMPFNAADGCGGFNPRAPRGARPVQPYFRFYASGFQSTRPARGATLPYPPSRPSARVSIHAPRAGRDRADERRVGNEGQFQSTRPARGAT